MSGSAVRYSSSASKWEEVFNSKPAEIGTVADRARPSPSIEREAKRGRFVHCRQEMGGSFRIVRDRLVPVGKPVRLSGREKQSGLQWRSEFDLGAVEQRSRRVENSVVRRSTLADPSEQCTGTIGSHFPSPFKQRNDRGTQLRVKALDAKNRGVDNLGSTHHPRPDCRSRFQRRPPPKIVRHRHTR